MRHLSRRRWWLHCRRWPRWLVGHPPNLTVEPGRTSRFEPFSEMDVHPRKIWSFIGNLIQASHLDWAQTRSSPEMPWLIVISNIFATKMVILGGSLPLPINTLTVWLVSASKRSEARQASNPDQDLDIWLWVKPAKTNRHICACLFLQTWSLIS